jgi:hypothetical protein
MKKNRVTGLVSAGGISESFLQRMPVLLRALGPVKAASFPVARRIVNSLHAGFAVAEYGPLGSCDLIWLAVPDGMLDRIVGELAARTKLEGTMIVPCGSARDSASLRRLAGGARVATLNVVADSDERMLIGEGHPDVMRRLFRLAAAEKRKLVEIRPGCKPVYLAGAHLATHLLLPWIGAAVESLRMAGFSRSEATTAVQAMGSRVLRGYINAGRRAWGPAAPLELHDALIRDIEDIRALDPRLAALYESGIQQALTFFEDEQAR